MFLRPCVEEPLFDNSSFNSERLMFRGIIMGLLILLIELSFTQLCSFMKEISDSCFLHLSHWIGFIDFTISSDKQPLFPQLTMSMALIHSSHILSLEVMRKHPQIMLFCSHVAIGGLRDCEWETYVSTGKWCAR